jgi:hypothetical protein
MTKKEELIKRIEENLTVPEKAEHGDENKEIEKKLGAFLAKEGYIKGVDINCENWGYLYCSDKRKIFVSELGMPHLKWEHCIFKMGTNEETNENFFPSPGTETEKYRFLHEANHAYQDFLCVCESPENPKEWYQKSLEGKIDSVYSELFNFCFHKRAEEDTEKGEKKDMERGLSIWGNAPNYNYKEKNSIPNRASELAVRAQEDANELVTMYLWHPNYFNTYLDYLSLNHNRHEIRELELTREDLEKKGLLRISKEEAEYLKEVVSSYIREMKKNINY